MAIAKDIGLERIDLEVFASNIAAVHMYEKLGFVHEGIKKKARKLDGQYDDILCMAFFCKHRSTFSSKFSRNSF